MLKRLLVLALAVSMALAVAVPLVGAQDDMMDYTIPEDTAVDCGTEDEATVTIVTGAVGAEQEVTQEAVDFFMSACPNVTVELFETPDSATDRLAFYLQFLEQESSDIDLYQIDVIWPGILAEHMLDMNEYAPADLIDSFFEPIVQNNTVDGELVALPWFTDAGLLYYRTDLLETYGVEVPQTWDELEAAAETIQAGEREAGNDEFWGFVWQGNAYEGLTCDGIEWQASSSGTTIVSPDGEIEVTDDAWIAQLEQAAGWVDTISPPGVTSYQEEDARNTWQQGNAAFMRNWPYAYSLGNAEDSPIAGQFDVAPLPAGEVGRAACLGGWNLAVSQYSENPDAAAALAVFLAGPESQKLRAIGASLNPTIESLYEDEDILAAAPFFGSLFDVFINATPRPSTVTGEQYNEVSVAYFEAVHSVLTGDQDAATAMELLELDLQEILAQ